MFNDVPVGGAPWRTTMDNYVGWEYGITGILYWNIYCFEITDRLNEEKQKILVTLAEDRGRQEKKAELIDFLHEQTAEFDEFDDGLVRRLIEQITVHENGTFTVEFKSGTMVEV